MPVVPRHFLYRPASLLRATCCALLLPMLAACGGGSSGSSSGGGNADIPQGPAPSSLTFTGDSSAVVGSAVGVVASVSEQGYNRFVWEQLDGPELGPLAGNGSAGISFDAVYAGEYSFRLTASDSVGNQQQDTFNISVSSAGSGSQVQLRADRAVTEGAEFSLRLNASRLTGSVNSWSFKQLSGPYASLQEDDSGEPVLFVTAPRVSRDEVLTFQATLETTTGSFSDIAYVVVQDRPDATSEYFCDGDGEYCATSAPLNNVYSYRTGSPYRNFLADCVYSNQLQDDNLCTLGRLPVIGMQSSAPTVDQIMDHVLVSHDWMGERFETFLT